MQDRYVESNANRAMRVFKSVISNSFTRSKLNNSSKTIIILTLLSYFGKSSKVKLQRAVPVASIQGALDELETLGYAEKSKEGREVYYEFKDSPEFSDKLKYNKYNPYLFANALMNISLYIKDYDIKSWNTLSMMLEVAMKADFSEDSSCVVQLTENDIESVTGARTNKMNLRKSLEHMGVIRGVFHRKGANKAVVGGKFKVNKDAYIFEIK